VSALLLLADHSMGAMALGFAGPPLLVFAGLAALVMRERLTRDNGRLHGRRSRRRTFGS
jgi:hypothetical protein